MGGLGVPLRELGKQGHQQKVLGQLRAEAIYLLLWKHIDTCTGSVADWRTPAAEQT